MKHLGYLAAVSAALLMTACGGGGGSSPPGDIGGSGKSHVRGPVTGFGSVIVNGVAYQTGSASIEIDDQAGGEGELEIGQIVEIVARGTVATRIRYDAELEGPVESVNVEGSSFVALGVTVMVAGTTVFEGVTLETLAAGDRVEISGEFDGSGVLHAAYVERDVSVSTEVELKGTVEAHDAATQQFRLRSLTVDYSAAARDPSGLVIENGQYVEVEGQLSGSVLLATEVELEDRSEDFESGDEAVIEGFIGQVLSSTQFTLAQLTVRHDSSTEFDGGSAADIRANVRVEVEGMIDAAGVLVADEIEFDDADRRELRIEIDGPAEAVGSDSITVLGITASVRSDTVVRDERDENDRLRASQIQPGDYVRIRAYIDAGAVVAGRIERDEAEDVVVLVAPLDSTDEAAAMVVVRGTSVDVSAASFTQGDEDISRSEFFARAAAGDFVEVEGTYDGSIVTAIEVELDN